MFLNNPFRLLASAVTRSIIADAAVSLVKLNSDVTSHFNIDILSTSGVYSALYTGNYFIVCVGGGAGGNGGFARGATTTLVSNAGRPGRSGEVKIGLVSLNAGTDYSIGIGVGGSGGGGETSTVDATVGVAGTDTVFYNLITAKGGQFTNMLDDVPSINQQLAFSAENQGFNTSTGLKGFLTNGQGVDGVVGVFPGGGGSGGGGNVNDPAPAFVGGKGGAGSKGVIIVVSI